MLHHRFLRGAGAIPFVLSLVIFGAAAQAQEPQSLCRTVLSQTEAFNVVATYSMTNMDRDGWQVKPDTSSQFGESGIYTERSDWLSRGELTAFEISSIRCIDGVLVVDGSTETGVGAVEQTNHGFEPPLPWLPFPLEAGRSWVWNGVYLHSDGSLNRQYQASFYGFVGEPKTVETLVGTFRCYPVTTDLTFFADTTQTTTRAESCISTEPYYLVVERTRQIVGLNPGPLQEFRLLSVETGGSE